jgi:hypothetical protein
MADINQVITLGIGTPGDIEHFILVGLNSAQAGVGGCVTVTDTYRWSVTLTDTYRWSVTLADAYRWSVTLSDTACG